MKKKKKKYESTGLTHQIRLQRKKKAYMKKKTNEEIEKKSELTRLTLQTRLTSQTWDSCHESLITE